MNSFKILFSILETCTWEIPNILATWLCVLSLKYLKLIISLSLEFNFFINSKIVILLTILFCSSSSSTNKSTISLSSSPTFAFMDSIKRIPVILNAIAMLQGIYGGWVDTSKLDKNALDWMRDLNKKINIQKENKKKN